MAILGKNKNNGQATGKRRRRYGILLCVVLPALIGWWFWLPSPLFSTHWSPVLYDEKGNLLKAFVASDQQWRFKPEFSDQNLLESKFATALITFEDKRFLSHPGVDLLALLRAFYSNLRHEHIVSGGSTLSMQVIRLSRGNRPRTYFEKLKEILLALRLEVSYSKSEILEMYATHAPFGGNLVGLEAAAWKYFSRPARSLSWAEAALLAVLPNAPSAMHLKKKRQALKNKRNRLLKKLFEHGHLDKLAFKLALAEPLPSGSREFPDRAGYLLSRLTRELGADSFKTTLNASIQQNAARELRSYQQLLDNAGVGHAAVIIIDNQNMTIKAWLGNSAFYDPQRPAWSLDLITRPRSSGSLLKPFLYAAMLEQGELAPHQLVKDLPVYFDGYSPQNFDRSFRGAVPASHALAQSLNVPAVNMLQQYGIDRFYQDLTQWGLTSLHRSAAEYGLPLILGGAEVSLLEISQAYANLARLSESNAFDRNQPIVSARLLQNTASRTVAPAPVSSGAAWLTLNALIEVKRPGIESHWRDFASSQTISWKTGTSFGLKDGWAIGVTPQWTVGVWTGNADGRGVPGLTGSSLAAPLLFRLFRQLPVTQQFKQPLASLKSIKVCKQDGFLATDDCPTRDDWIPATSHYHQLSPHYQSVHLDHRSGYRVNARCEKLRNFRTQTYFVLPPAVAWFYKNYHHDYRPLPDWRDDCQPQQETVPLAVLYPQANARLYLPIDLNGERSAVIARATHKNPEQKLFWHLDGHYLGSTRLFHQQQIKGESGWHRLTIVDEAGNLVETRFELLGKKSSQQ